MKRYLSEIIILIIQLIMFYLFPLTAGPTDAMGMVVIILLSVLITSLILGSISNNKIKYAYPVIISILFIPSVFIYYNSSALIHAVWYLVLSLVGTVIGSILNKVFKR